MRAKTIILLLIIISGSASWSQTGHESLRTKHFNLTGGWAIDGYDPVSYFLNKPEEGDKKIWLIHQGIRYAFTSVSHREQFKKSPATYEPQYGGWCAYAMGATGEKVEVDPETFKIVNGKLYLFYHSFLNNTLLKWNEQEGALKAKADRNWMNHYR